MLRNDRVEIGDEVVAPHGITNVVDIEIIPPALPRRVRASYNPRAVRLGVIKHLNRKIHHKSYAVLIGVSPTAEWRRLFPDRSAMYFKPNQLRPIDE